MSKHANRSITTAVAVLVSLVAPLAASAQAGTGRATGTARSSITRTGLGLTGRTGIASRLGDARTGIANRLDGRSITAGAWGLTSRDRTRNTLGGLGWSSNGRYTTRSTFSRGSTREIIHCSGVTVVGATTIWGGGASLRNCGAPSSGRQSRSSVIVIPGYGYYPAPYAHNAGPYGYVEPMYYPAAPYPTTQTYVIAPSGAVQPSARQPTTYRTFDFTRPSALVLAPGPFALPFPVYTAMGSSVIYVEHAPGAAGVTQPESACARVTVILPQGDGWWKTVWLPALGAATVDELRAALGNRIGAAPVTVTDATGASFQVPPPGQVSNLLVDRCPA